MTDTTLITVRLPDEDKTRLDQAAPNNRSEFLRQALREKLAKARATSYADKGAIVAGIRAALDELEAQESQT